MKLGEHTRNDFIPHAPNRVVGTIPDASKARTVIKVLGQGAKADDIDLLHGDPGIRRLDRADADLRLLVERCWRCRR